MPKQRWCAVIAFPEFGLGAERLPFFWHGVPNIGGRFGDVVCVGLSTTPTQGGAEPRTPNPDTNGGLGAKPPDCRQRRQLCRLPAKTTCRGGPFRGPPLDKELYETLWVRVRVRKKGFGFGFFPNLFYIRRNRFQILVSTFAESDFRFRFTYAESLSAYVAKPLRGGAEQTRRCREP